MIYFFLRRRMFSPQEIVVVLTALAIEIARMMMVDVFVLDGAPPQRRALRLLLAIRGLLYRQLTSCHILKDELLCPCYS